MKIAINFENLPKDGGAFHENILLTEVFKAFKDTKIPDDLAKKLLEIEANKHEVENLKNDAYNFYNSFCSLGKIKKTYSDIF